MVIVVYDKLTGFRSLTNEAIVFLEQCENRVGDLRDLL